MSLGYILLQNAPLNGHCHEMADEIEFKAGRFKYYQRHKPETKSRERKYFSQCGKKKAISYPGLTKDQQKGEKAKQTNKQLTWNFRLFLVLSSSNSQNYYRVLFHYYFVCIRTTGYASKWPNIAFYHAYIPTLGTTFDFIIQNVSAAWICHLGDMEKVLYHLQTVTYPDNINYWYQSAHLVYWYFLIFI